MRPKLALDTQGSDCVRLLRGCEDKWKDQAATNLKMQGGFLRLAKSWSRSLVTLRWQRDDFAARAMTAACEGYLQYHSPSSVSPAGPLLSGTQELLSYAAGQSKWLWVVLSCPLPPDGSSCVCLRHAPRMPDLLLT